ncbi:hypothetical protein BCR44DRAFT_39655 [Catenaria anguillulae PL171]|uniref:Uncharacterized protein n=1 Tax=Catenaria anguillulae PL171 TaxID=765915 RepID=A0A1Y2HGY3_9FUNG|nr:hypothetical protein BCR44DRAFT_39655 [Catenaria anguillulae PL171]
MSFVAIALSSALMLTTPLLVAERSELLADHATAEPVVSPLQPPRRQQSSSPAPLSSIGHESPAEIGGTIDMPTAQKDDDLLALSKRTDSAVSVSSMAPLSISTARFGSNNNDLLVKSPTPVTTDEAHVDDEGLALTDARVDDLLTSPDAPLSFKAARQLLFPEPSLVALPFPTTLMDFAMDAPAVKNALPVVDGAEGDDAEEQEAENERREEWVVKSHAGGISAQAAHVGIGFPFGI